MEAIPAVCKYIRQRRESSIFQIEGSLLGGLIVLNGFKGVFTLDIHGFYFDELKFNYSHPMVNVPYNLVMREIEAYFDMFKIHEKSCY